MKILHVVSLVTNRSKLSILSFHVENLAIFMSFFICHISYFSLPTYHFLLLSFHFLRNCSLLNHRRQDKTKITHCRIGHTSITHACLLINEDPPCCISCNEPFKIKHPLISCIEFGRIHVKYLNSKTVNDF